MNAEEAYLKALTAKKRLPDLESIILQNVYYSYLYAKDVIKGKWEEAEAIIAKDAYYSYHYAKDVLKWKIKGNKDFYISAIPILWNFLPKRVKSNCDIMTAYFKEIIQR
jgi:hypothetical protein